MNFDIIAWITVVGVLICLIFLFIVFMVVSWVIGTMVANYLNFNGILWWGCSLLFTLIILSLGGSAVAVTQNN